MPPVLSCALGALPTTDVLCGRDGLEVVGVAAGTISAEVVDLQASRDRPLVLLKHEAVDVDATSIKSDSAVPASVRRDVEKPAATVGLNMHTSLNTVV